MILSGLESRRAIAAPDENMQPKTLGVVAGLATTLAIGAFLVAEAWRERPAEPEETAALEEQAETNIRAMQDALTERVSKATASEEQERIDSPRGQALSRRCADWSDLVERAPTDDNRAERDRACTAYRQFVLTGQDSD